MTDANITSGDLTVGGNPRRDSPDLVGQLYNSDEALLSDFANFQEGYVRHYIALSDTKAGILFGFVSTFIAFIFSKPIFSTLLFNSTQRWESWVAWVCAALLITSASLAAWVIAPRLKTTGEGLIFFGAVSAHSSSETYLGAVRSAGAARLAEARLMHCYDVSAVCWRKYHNLRVAIWLSVAGLAVSLPLLGLI